MTISKTNEKKSKSFFRKLGAGLMAGLCAVSMIGTSIGGTVTANAASVSTTENSAFPSADTVIAQAAELLGSPYGWGFKGYTGVYYQGSYSPLSLDYVRNQGVDCSGLVYYTLTHLGYKTSGFSWNNPVPVDTTHWLSVSDNCTISYGGVTSKIDVEKKNVKSTSAAIIRFRKSVRQRVISLMRLYILSVQKPRTTKSNQTWYLLTLLRTLSRERSLS